MKLYEEIDTLDEFEPWSGAKWVYEKIVSANKGAEFISMLEDVYPEGLTNTELNDILWFDSDWCFELVGLNKDDEDDEENEEELDEEDY